jgi:hypothetical protein
MLRSLTTDLSAVLSAPQIGHVGIALAASREYLAADGFPAPLCVLNSPR